jgi:DNA protecting protein DprA
MKQRVITDILFLSYFTQYNITEIYRAFDYGSIDDFIEDYIRHKRDSGYQIESSFIKQCWNDAYTRYEEMKYSGIQFISYFSPEYPSKLKELSKAPPLLYIKGHLKNERNVAIVGSRITSQFADETVSKIVKIFLENNYGTVSGLAYGIDKMAHEHTLNNKGYTVAVLPNSLDYVYPKEHISLANEILDKGGAIVSEVPKGINLGKKGFVQRNRIQSGLSEIVFPVEMGTNSGTMHTVQFCIQQKRKLYLIQPSEDKKSLPEYEGIFELLNRKYENLKILPTEFTWRDIEDTQNTTNHIALFDFVMSNGSGKTITLFTLEAKNIIKLTEDDLVRKVNTDKAAAGNNIIRYDEFKSHLIKKILELAQKYLSDYPELTRRELEKPITSSLKEFAIKFQDITSG